MKSKGEMRQYPRANDAWKHRFQSSSDRHGHLLASVKHHSTNLGRRVVLCLGLSAVTKHLQSAPPAQVIRNKRCLKEYL